MQHKTRLELIFHIKLILSAIMLFFILMGFIVAYELVFEPAYVSVASFCNLKTDAEIKAMGYSTGGDYNPESKEIRIFMPEQYIKSIQFKVKKNQYLYDLSSEYDDSWQGRNEYKKTSMYKRISKHEACHKKQDSENRLNANCNQLVRFWIDESECYVKMRL